MNIYLKKWGSERGGEERERERDGRETEEREREGELRGTYRHIVEGVVWLQRRKIKPKLLPLPSVRVAGPTNKLKRER